MMVEVGMGELIDPEPEAGKPRSTQNWYYYDDGQYNDIYKNATKAADITGHVQAIYRRERAVEADGTTHGREGTERLVTTVIPNPVKMAAYGRTQPL